jgi:cytidine deaminase
VSEESQSQLEGADPAVIDQPRKLYLPELVVCLAAAAGTDTAAVTDALAAELRSVGYDPLPIRLSTLMGELPGFEHLKSIEAEDERIRASMDAGNAIRRKLGNDGVVRLALAEIQEARTHRNDDQDPTVPAEACCFIIRSLKRSEEIDTLRAVLGQRVFLLSIYEPRDQRAQNLCMRIARSRKSPDESEFASVAAELIEADQKERSEKAGQRLEDVFPLADVFLKAGTTLREDVRRFVQLLFRAPFITPTMDEFLMFHARATAQRSADLSRQVGAVIATTRGEILATGCNEVPRAGGGVNWDDVAGSDKDYRDYKLGYDPASAAKKVIVAGALEALSRAGWLAPNYANKSADELAQLALFSEERPLDGTAVTSLLEFGRIVHGEMAAICDAAMRGVSVKDAVLFCTTFPCHMCARHIVAAGLKRVVYIEPYPKSRAKILYKRAIQVDVDREADLDAVKFESFVGVAPRRFLDLFNFVERKDHHGYALDSPAPVGMPPKAVTLGSYVSDLESTYVASINQLQKEEN